MRSIFSVGLYKKFLFLLLVIMSAWTLYLTIVSQKQSFLNYSYNSGLGILYLAGMIPALHFFLQRNNDSITSKIFLYFGIGQLVWALGAFSWLYYNSVLSIEMPYPSAADILFFAFNLFTGLACWYLLKKMKITITASRVITPFLAIFLIYILGAFLLTWQELTSGSLLEVFINFMYPICDAFLFALAFVIFNNQEKWNIGVLYLVVGLLIQVIGDIMYSILDALGTYWNGSTPDLLYAVSGFFLGMSILYLQQYFSQESNQSLS